MFIHCVSGEVTRELMYT